MDQELTPSEAHEEENVSAVMSKNEAELTAQVCDVCNKGFNNLEWGIYFIKRKHTSNSRIC